MDINVLKTYVAVCEYSGFSAAGEKLGYSQSTVSSQIKQLENELNTVLFDRIRHGVKMTSQGAILLDYATEVLAMHQQMLTDLHAPETISGEIRLAMASSICSRFFTTDYLEFHKRYPQITLKITAAGTDQMFDMLRKNEADLVFTLDAPIRDPEIRVVGESIEGTHFVASTQHPLASRESVTPEELVQEPFYLTESSMSYRHIMDTYLAAHGLSISPMLEIGNPTQICDLLQAGQALSFLPDYITEEYVRNGSLVHLQVPDLHLPVWNQLLIHKHKWHSPAIQAFIHYYREVIARIDTQDISPSASSGWITL